ncbi:MAG: hypothetical protein DRH51_01455 [Candidatus Coatesbacteria bacterium]|nr:MAG: hypothetical protein DRH51_01455 [Candidatus Coatesbacteria bacterium]
MRSIFLLYVLLVVFPVCPVIGVIELSDEPDWTSDEADYDDYSTGGAFVDINGDILLDFVCGNGNDMSSDYNCVYYNTGNIFEEEASWRSGDEDYGAHIACGDLNKDGFMDMVIGNFWGSGEQAYADEVYFNTGDGLESEPSWHSGVLNHTFGVCLIDFDGDGDLDIATASSNRYIGVKSPILLYRNDDGNISVFPVWSSADSFYGSDVFAGDINGDGWLDLVVACDGEENVAFINQGGYFRDSPDWVSTEKRGSIRCVLGDVNGDGWLDLAVADNEQLTSEDSRVRVYINQGGELESTASWVSGVDDMKYYSCVAFGDVDNDGDLDLASGGWWEPVVVFENIDGVLESEPSWEWQPSKSSQLVCETVVWGDIDSNGLVYTTDYLSGDGVRHTYYLDHKPVYQLGDVRVDGEVIPYSDYCYDYKEGWISFAEPPSDGDDNIEVDYTFSVSLDLGVTNWHSSTGNYLFFNQIDVGLFDVAFSAERKGDDIILRWQIIDNCFDGYNIYREMGVVQDYGVVNSLKAKVNDDLIVGSSPFRYIDDSVVNEQLTYTLTGVSGDSEDVLATVRVYPQTCPSFAFAMVYPNPLSHTATVNYTVNGDVGQIELRVFDISGRLMNVHSVNSERGEHNFIFDRDDIGLADGVYILQLTDGYVSDFRRVVIY